MVANLGHLAFHVLKASYTISKRRPAYLIALINFRGASDSRDLQVEASTVEVSNTWLTHLGTDFYIDPSSELELELGTQNYPYKSITYALVELFNEFAFTELPVTIHLKQGTVDEITESIVTLGLASLTVT